MILLQYDNVRQLADFVRNGGNLLTDEGLETAVTISLFTNARAEDSDGLDPKQDQGGWWGSKYLDDNARPLGSRLWLLRRQPMTESGLLLSNQYAQEALQWMIDAGVAATVSAQTTLSNFVPQPGGALLTIGITRPNTIAPRFSKAWAVQFAV